MKKYNSVFRAVAFLVSVSFVLVSGGCGASKGDLAGTVKSKGALLKKGQVMAQSASGLVVAGDIAEDGTYTIKGIPTGTAKIAVSVQSDEAVEYFKKMSAGSRGGQKDGKGTGTASLKENPNASVIDLKYSDFALSELSTAISSGKNTFDIDLK